MNVDVNMNTNASFSLDRLFDPHHHKTLRLTQRSSAQCSLTMNLTTRWNCSKLKGGFRQLLRSYEKLTVARLGGNSPKRILNLDKGVAIWPFYMVPCLRDDSCWTQSWLEFVQVTNVPAPAYF